jgi:hypothetical protein
VRPFSKRPYQTVKFVSIHDGIRFGLLQVKMQPFLQLVLDGGIVVCDNHRHYRDRDSSVGMATGYGLDGPGIESGEGNAAALMRLAQLIRTD